MLDRALGIFGIALTLIAVVIPMRWPEMPKWAIDIVLGFGCGLIGFAIGLALNPSGRTERTAKDASLFLQFTDEHTIPKEIRQTNVLSWYALYTESIYVNTQNEQKQSLGGFSVPPRWTVFILFKNPITYRQMIAKCAGDKTPHCAVQFSNDRYAIITLAGEVSHNTLDVSIIQ
jgi:hypothetical protein